MTKDDVLKYTQEVLCLGSPFVSYAPVGHGFNQIELVYEYYIAPNQTFYIYDMVDAKNVERVVLQFGGSIIYTESTFEFIKGIYHFYKHGLFDKKIQVCDYWMKEFIQNKLVEEIITKTYKPKV